eukprot:jgi/Psemu1/22824/gm1.22824_g
MINANKMTSPKSVNETNRYSYGDSGYDRTYIASAGSRSNVGATHQHRDEWWSRERVLVPRSDSFYQESNHEEDEYSTSLVSPNNDIRISKGSDSQSMMLFSDNLVSQEIRSVIKNVKEDDDYERGSPERYRFASDNTSLDSSYNFALSEDNSGRSPPPPGVVVVLDGSPLFPSYSQPEDNMSDADRTVSNTSIFVNNTEDNDNDTDNHDSAFSTTIRRTFAFDDQLPMIHNCFQSASFCMTDSFEEDDYDAYCYSQGPLSFTIPITTSSYEHGINTGTTKLLYHVSPTPWNM